ncbi:Fur family transcriptional regulator [Geoalkalibacter halelectricus]|uniref:Transcriptional repressor n=1 Tax=Geoalkalibacter halelectricus TaxID=2847045 RepID=A0ABY5ZIS0_9BACT|nr:Fur family transcriptional regulator [Geoalkalibacter halelectricus]MDO3377796.1 transcriptional repressor [Geoalkalibacter halelectricus]UWZ78611.1 transcriptional repressor [Geoalkalibacter halelectricus]
METCPEHPFPSQDHDHERCVAGALDAAEAICRERGARLTDLRRRVLELVWSSHKPVGAYAVLARLQEQGSAAPPTVYRALDFLLEQGLIHRVSSLNAFVGCVRPGEEHCGQFLICEQCQDLVELDDADISAAIARSSHASGFAPRRQTVEILGLCPQCRG